MRNRRGLITGGEHSREVRFIACKCLIVRMYGLPERICLLREYGIVAYNAVDNFLHRENVVRLGIDIEAVVAVMSKLICEINVLAERLGILCAVVVSKTGVDMYSSALIDGFSSSTLAR